MSKTLSATPTRASETACSSAVPGGFTGTGAPSKALKSSEQSRLRGKATGRRSARSRVIDSSERPGRRAAEVGPDLNESATDAAGLHTTNQPSIRPGPVLAFDSADERFIDFLVEEALNEWRAKNF